MKKLISLLMAVLLAAGAAAAAGQGLEQPGIPAADPARIAEALHVVGDGIAVSNPAGLAWPMLPAEEDGFSCITSTNWGIDDSMAAVNLRVEADAGEVLSFWFKTSMEAGFDVLQLCVNGEVAKTFTGESAWRQYAHTFPEKGVYEVAFRYVKDSVSSAGSDAAYIRDVQLLTGDAAAAALAANPVYPEGTGRLLTVITPGAREITFEDPSFALTAVHGIARYFIVPGDRVKLTAALDAEDDPDGAVVVIDDDTEAAILLSGIAASDGYTIAASMAEDFVVISLYPYNGCSTFEMRTVVCFPDEAAVDAYVRLLQANAYQVHGWSEVSKTSCMLTMIDQHGEFLEDVTVSVTSMEGVTRLTSDAEGNVNFDAANGMVYVVRVVDAPDGYDFDPNRAWTLDASSGLVIIDLTRTDE